MRLKEHELYKEHLYWHGTLAQLFVGLTPEQTRYLSKADNARMTTQSEDIASSKFEVNIQKYKYKAFR